MITCRKCEEYSFTGVCKECITGIDSRLLEMEYALVGGNIVGKLVPKQVVSDWLHYVKTGDVINRIGKHPLEKRIDKFIEKNVKMQCIRCKQQPLELNNKGVCKECWGTFKESDET